MNHKLDVQVAETMGIHYQDFGYRIRKINSDGSWSEDWSPSSNPIHCSEMEQWVWNEKRIRFNVENCCGSMIVSPFPCEKDVSVNHLHLGDPIHAVCEAKCLVMLLI